MIIHMVSEHASPLAALGGADAGGQNVHVAALSDQLARRGHEVRVFTRRDDEALPDEVRLGPRLVVEHVPAGPARSITKDDLLAYMPEFGEWLRRRWRRDPPDVVHAHFWMSGLAALQGARELGVPVVQTFHALGCVKRRHQAEADTSPPQRVALETRIAKEAAAVIATSTSEVSDLCALGISPDGVEVIPCGVDLDHFRPLRSVRSPRPSDARLLSIGRLVPRKGVATLIEALAEVPRAELLVAGGPDGAGLRRDPEVRRLRRLAAGAGVADRVRFLGSVGHDQVPALMRSAHAVVSVPWYEPFGIVPVEAMACGVPVVASAVGGRLDTVEDEVTGLLVPARSASGLASRLRWLLERPDLMAAMGRAGARRARTRYGWPGIAAATETVYAGLATAVARYATA